MQPLRSEPHDERTTKTITDVARMTLQRFADAGLIVSVHSELLDEIVLFASDNAVVPGGEERRVYRAADLDRLLRLRT